jgi:hypothetical protein
MCGIPTCNVANNIVQCASWQTSCHGTHTNATCSNRGGSDDGADGAELTDVWMAWHDAELKAGDYSNRSSASPTCFCFFWWRRDFVGSGQNVVVSLESIGEQIVCCSAYERLTGTCGLLATRHRLHHGWPVSRAAWSSVCLSCSHLWGYHTRVDVACIYRTRVDAAYLARTCGDVACWLLSGA